MTRRRRDRNRTWPADAAALAGQAMYDAAIRMVHETDDVARFELGLVQELAGRDPCRDEVEIEVEEMFR